MDFALQNTLELVLIIALGIFLQQKIAKQDLNGIKTLILSIALPATIFVALLKIELKGSLIIFPLLALVFNLFMFLSSEHILGRSLPKEEGAKKRTLTMLLPSLAPGLSCFPFIVVFLGDEYLALAALADVGNKIFVLILLYILAMNWYHRRAIRTVVVNTKSKLKSLFISMLNEPINLVIVTALVLLGLGLGLSSFPLFLRNTVTTMSLIMTPLVLLFIGMAVRLKWKELGIIFSLLVKRAGITFCWSAILVFLLPSLTYPMILLLVVFPQSACSFWSLAHISSVSALENKDGQQRPTFDMDFAVNILACSLPFSTIIIIGIFSFSEFFVSPMPLFLLGIGMTFCAFIPDIIRKITKTGAFYSHPNFSNYSAEKLEKALKNNLTKWMP